MAQPPAATSLAEAHVTALASRLGGLPDVRLPPSALRQVRRCAAAARRAALIRDNNARQGVADDAAGRAAYVDGLLRRDPALFLGTLPCTPVCARATRRRGA